MKLTDAQRAEVERHAGLVQWFVGREEISPFVRRYGRDDVIQSAWLGLCHAIRRYDPEKGGLSTYAYMWMKNAVHRLESKSVDTSPLSGDVAGEEVDRPPCYESYRHLAYPDHLPRLDAVFREGLSYRDVAARFGVSKAAVQYTVRQFARRVRECLS